MSKESVYKVLANMQQSLTSAEQQQARENIGAAAASDIPAAQVNADWDANSGVAEILHKPSLAAVATSGSYNDLTDKPTIPSGQVNSDWNASSGVAQILNKPTVAELRTKDTSGGSPVYKQLTQMTLGLTKSEIYGVQEGDASNTMFGVYGPYPQSTDDGKFLKAVYGSSNTCSAVWATPTDTKPVAGDNIVVSNATVSCPHVIKCSLTHVSNAAANSSTDVEYYIFDEKMCVKLDYSPNGGSGNSPIDIYLKSNVTSTDGFTAAVTWWVSVTNDLSCTPQFSMLYGNDSYVKIGGITTYGNGAWFDTDPAVMCIQADIVFPMTANTAHFGKLHLMRSRSFIYTYWTYQT